MRGIRRLTVLLLGLAMLLSLAACGGDGRSSGTSEGNVALQERVNEELIYFAEDLDFELGSGVANVDFKVYGMNVYYPDGQSIVTYSCAEEEKSADVYRWEDAPGEWSFERVCYGGAGEVYGVVNVPAGTNSTYYLCRFDADRNVTSAWDLTESYRDAGEGFSPESRLEVGDDGRVYLSNKGGLWILGADGSYEGTVSFGAIEDVWVRDFQSSEAGKLYVLYEDKTSREQYVAEIDTKEEAVTAVQQTIGLTGISASQEKLLGFNGVTVYTYDREEMALTELFAWAECSVNGSAVYGVKQLSDGRVFVAGAPSWGGVENFLVKSMQVDTPEASESGKIDIRVALYGNPSNELAVVASRFNSRSEKYNVILENYRENSGEEAVARLESEIASGKGPDIVHTGFGMTRSLLEDGYLEDLSMWLAESAEISEGDFQNFAMEEYNVDGILAAIPQRFYITFVIGNAEFVGADPGWTMEDFVELLEENQGNQVYAAYEYVRNVVWDIMRLNEEYFIDQDAGTCNFDNDIFRRLVEATADYPLEYVRVEDAPSEYTNLQNGTGILSTINITDFTDLQPYWEVMGDNLNCIGFPVEEGVGVMAWTRDALSMSALSEHKEAAWEFLEMFLQYSSGDSHASEFPTYIPNLEKMAENSLKPASGKRKMNATDGFTYEYHTPTQEEVDQYLALMEGARTGFTDVGIVNIIMEELANYRDGNKTMDEMIASIEERVNLYLTED